MLRRTEHSPVSRFDLARTIGGRGRYWTTAYLVDGLMIDTGCAHCSSELLAALEDDRVEQIVNTHTHEDHIGSDGPLQGRYNLPIKAHPEALPVIHDPRREQPLHPYRKLMWGWPEPARAEALVDGDEIRTPKHRFQVIYTPGHAIDHLCLYEPDHRWLFTGDLYVGGRDRAIRAGADIWQIIDCLKLIRALEVNVMFPGSARIPDNGHAALGAKIDHLMRFGDRVLELEHRGLSVGAIVRQLSGPPMWIEALTFGHFSRRRLILSYLKQNDDLPGRR